MAKRHATAIISFRLPRHGGAFAPNELPLPQRLLLREQIKLKTYQGQKNVFLKGVFFCALPRVLPKKIIFLKIVQQTRLPLRLMGENKTTRRFLV